MNPLLELRAALTGWTDILTQRPGAIDRFRPTVAGILVALLWFVIAVLLSIAAQSASIGMPSPAQVMFILLGQGLTLACLALVLAQTLRFLRTNVPLFVLLVPTTYAYAVLFVAAIPLALLGPAAALVAVLAMGIAVGLAGRAMAGLRVGVAAALGALSVIVLVVVPNALYMLFLQLPSPA